MYKINEAELKEIIRSYGLVLRPREYEEHQRKREEVKLANKREHERILDKANIGWSERSAAKIVKKADGTTQIYHGGLGKGDGLGHGHVTLAKDGHVTYYRDQWQDKNQGQYLIDESKDDHTKI